jgi:hypothetical protein
MMSQMAKFKEQGRYRRKGGLAVRHTQSRARTTNARCAILRGLAYTLFTVSEQAKDSRCLMEESSRGLVFTLVAEVEQHHSRTAFCYVKR